MFVLRIISLGVFISLYRGVDGIQQQTFRVQYPYLVRKNLIWKPYAFSVSTFPLECFAFLYKFAGDVG